MIKHASIVPLIGGEAIGSEKAFGTPPDFILSYDAFKAHDSHLLNYYASRGEDVPYHSLDSGKPGFDVSADVVSSVCPCAGLSQLSRVSGSDNSANDWMMKTADYVLSEVKPEVYWGENAPALFTGMGEGVRNKLRAIGNRHGYAMSFFKTKSSLHGLSQVRNRTFFFFWKGNESPTFDYVSREPQNVEDLLAGVRSNFQHEPINTKTPSENPYYRYLMETSGATSHRDYMNRFMFKMPSRANDVQSIIEARDGGLYKVAEWLLSNGLEKRSKRCFEMDAKLKAGGSIMRRETILPRGVIGAFVGHYPMMLAHHAEDRYITYREAMTIMGLPTDFELLNPKKNVNHICQNVPVQTAEDMANQVRRILEDRNCVEWNVGETYTSNPARWTEVKHH